MNLDPRAQNDLGFCSLGWGDATTLPARGVRTPGSQLHVSVWIRPKARPCLGTRSPGRPPTPVRQQRPGPKWKDSPLPAIDASSPPLDPPPRGTAWCWVPGVPAAPATDKPRTHLWSPRPPEGSLRPPGSWLQSIWKAGRREGPGGQRTTSPRERRRSDHTPEV